MFFGGGQFAGPLVQVGQQPLHLHPFFASHFTSTVQQVIRETHPSSNVESVAGAGVAHPEGEQRAQVAFVIIHGRIDHVGMVVHRGLQQPEVGRSQYPRTTVGQLLKHRKSQGRTFLRISAAANFIAHHEGAGIGLAHEFAQMPQVGRKAAQGFGDGLVVAEVGQQAGRQGQYRIFAGRDVPTTLGQQAKNGHRFESNRFATGVGTTDDQHPRCGGQLQIQRHHLGASLARIALAQSRQQQRMAATAHADFAHFAEHRPLPLDLLAPQHGRPHGVQQDHDLGRFVQGAGSFFHGAVQLEQDAGLFGGNLKSRAGQFVGQPHHARRFYK